jgi:putative restriction endonuclease
MDDLLYKYLSYFKKLKRAYNKGLGKAPHKPILLLSICQLINNNIIPSNKIFITPELVLAFKTNWNNYVDSKHIPNFSLPFFHLRSEPFWNIVAIPGFQIELTKSKSIKSFRNLKENVAFAEIDKELFELLQNTDTNLTFQEFILKEYFNINNYAPSQSLPFQLQIQIENEILNEDKLTYQSRINELQHKLDDEEFQEEIFIRGGLFKKTIPKIYGYKCCISEMKIETTTNAQMVDACHIIPFSISHDDTIPNGISLSPNLHRAFDRGLLTINKEYIVRISPTVTDNNSTYSLSQFNGKQIILPKKLQHYPSLQSLIWHSKEIYQL